MKAYKLQPSKFAQTDKEFFLRGNIFCEERERKQKEKKKKEKKTLKNK